MTQKPIFPNYHPPTYEACNIILLNMKNHYRRLYSAKPAVDTSPPESYKLLTRKTSRSLSCLDLNLANLPSYKLYERSDIKDDLHNHEVQRRTKSIVKRHSCICVDEASNQRCREKSRVKPSVSSCHQNRQPFLINMENSKVYTSKEKVVDAGKACSESSQDSAYNEGEIGSSERGSRTPTPETVVNSPSKLAPNVALGSSTYYRRTRSYLYLKFLAEITEEILKKGVVTNKALKQIFKQHLDANSYNLNQHRMQLELETLRTKLGIPENDALNSADFGVGSGGGPTCQPLFQDLPGSDNQVNTRSVLQKGLLASKMAWTPEVLEAFAVLGDNQKLINNIQLSVKNVVKNLRQVSSSITEPKTSPCVSLTSSNSPRKIGRSCSLVMDESVNPENITPQGSSLGVSHQNSCTTQKNTYSPKSSKDNSKVSFVGSEISDNSQYEGMQDSILEKTDGLSHQSSDKIQESIDSLKSRKKSCDPLLPYSDTEGFQMAEWEKDVVVSQKSSQNCESNSPQNSRTNIALDLEDSQEIGKSEILCEEKKAEPLAESFSESEFDNDGIFDAERKEASPNQLKEDSVDPCSVKKLSKTEVIS